MMFIRYYILSVIVKTVWSETKIEKLGNIQMKRWSGYIFLSRHEIWFCVSNKNMEWVGSCLLQDLRCLVGRCFILTPDRRSGSFQVIFFASTFSVRDCFLYRPDVVSHWCIQGINALFQWALVSFSWGPASVPFKD